MPDNAKYMKGDWIRWRQSGELTLGEIAYIQIAPFPKSSRILYVTDKGSVDEEQVLEARGIGGLYDV